MNPPRQSVLILIVADLSPRSSRYTSTPFGSWAWTTLG